MIRRFFGIMVFICTIATASFGQDIIGHARIEQWATQLRHNFPARKEIALHQTDIFLAQLVPQAGMPVPDFCTLGNPTNL